MQKSIRNLSVIARFDNPGQRWVNRISPNCVTHEGDFLIHVIGLNVDDHWIGHAIGIIHPVEWNRRGQRRMRSDKRYIKPKYGRSKLAPAICSTARSAAHHSTPSSGGRGSFAERNTSRSVPHDVFEKVKLRMLPREPGSIAVVFACDLVVRFFAAQQCFITKIFVPGSGVKFAYPKRSVAQTGHGTTQVWTAAALHFCRLTGNRFRPRITEDPGRRRLTASSNCISSGNARPGRSSKRGKT
jgi:hypothetical protein